MSIDHDGGKSGADESHHTNPENDKNAVKLFADLQNLKAHDANPNAIGMFQADVNQAFKEIQKDPVKWQQLQQDFQSLATPGDWVPNLTPLKDGSILISSAEGGPGQRALDPNLKFSDIVVAPQNNGVEVKAHVTGDKEKEFRDEQIARHGGKMPGT